ncbi:zinc finger protein 830 [Drosophila montana]|uniref:zinc finger protein 830 n=1 Tax=Drosophila montana TaxID=40370 RepID=UPI00313CB35D
MDKSKEIVEINLKNRRKSEIKCKFIKVDSPIAKYDSSGNLSCILCRIPIKSNVWKVHLTSRQHKRNLELAKRQRINTGNSCEILNPANYEQTPQKAECISLNEIQLQPSNSDKMPQAQVNTVQVLPEKFFDHEKSLNFLGSDRDPETEWIKFQREIREAATISNNIVSEEQESLNIKRHLKEIDEQIENWKRFITINDKKNDILKNQRNTKTIKYKEEYSSSEEGSVDTLLDWRIKSVHK